MIDCSEFYNFLKEEIDFFCGVPDSLLKSFNAYILENVPKDKHVITANEGGAIALATGYYLSTKKIPLVYMQNAGQGNALNPLVSLADKKVYSIPMILMIGWRGFPGEKDEPQHIKQGEITLDILKSLGIKYEILSNEMEEAKGDIKNLIEYAKKNSAPCAIVIKKGTFLPYSLKKEDISGYNLTREDAIKSIIDSLDEKDIVITSTGKISRELFEYREKKGQKHEKDFLSVGSMGHCSQIALGIALKKPNRKIYCLDGDGSAIMHMGSLAIIGQQNPKNFIHIILNNGSHESVGGQPTAGFRIDFSEIARSCGYSNAWEIEKIEELKEKLSSLKEKEGPILLEIRINIASRENLGRPNISPIKNKEDFMKFLE